MQDILINWTPQETRVAVVENGSVQELHLERSLERGLVGNIYAGRVARVLPGMQSAFIDIGLERAAFLHVADVHVAGQAGGSSSICVGLLGNWTDAELASLLLPVCLGARAVGGSMSMRPPLI